MSTLNDVVINKLSGGLGRRTPDQDMVSGLLFDGAETDELKYGELKRLLSIEDAEALGITESYDRDGQSAYYQISQFFRMNPSGDLFIMLTLEGEDFEDTVLQALKMQENANGALRQIGVFQKNIDKDFALTIDAVVVAQNQANLAFKNYMPFEVIIEGKGFDAAAAATITDLSTVNAENVSVVVAMDPATARLNGTGVDNDGNPIVTPNYTNTAAVGTLLGTISAAKVSENVAWVEKFNLAGDGFRTAGFVGDTKVGTSGDLVTLNDKKYIFARTHTGLGGVYFNDSHTCSEPTSDFTYVESNRTINKASRLVRTALLPKLNAPVLVDPEQGTLPPSVVKSFETLCKAALERMVANGEASDIDVYVNPFQDILATSELNIKVEVVPMGTARRIQVDLGFKNPFGINAAA